MNERALMQLAFDALVGARDAWGQPEFPSVNTESVLRAIHTALSTPVAQPWLPIETAPQDGRTILLGRHNELGKWRTMRGQWMSQECIDETWEDPDNGEPGWFETSAEADDVPNCWATDPTHWMPLPKAPT